MPNKTSDLEDILNFVPLDGRIGTAGQPSAEQWRAVGEAGYQVVVNLAMPDSLGFLADEADLVAAQGMQYIAQPVVWTAPTARDVEQFFVTMRAHEDEKVFVHCAMNMRVSAFLYLYRVKVQGASEEEARAAMQRIWTPNETWQQLIDEVLRDAPKQ